MSNQQLLRAHLESGIRAHNEGNIESAKVAYLCALALTPDHPDALHLLGVALLQLGETTSAVDYLERAARKLRDSPAVAGNLAQAYFSLQRYAEAHAMFRKACRLDPRNVRFQLGVANSLALQGKHAEATGLLRNLAHRFPDNALVWFNLGNALRDQSAADDALASYRQALHLDARLVQARNNLADLLHKLLRFEEAEREYRACIDVAPEYLLARCNLASVVMDLGRFGEAEALCREVAARAPDEAQAHTLLGAALGHQGKLLDALQAHRTAARLATRDAKVAQNLAATLTDCGRLPEAMCWFARSLALNPDLASTHLLMGYALLGQGRLAEGWAEYGYRPWPDLFRAQYPHILLARTLPADVSGKHICIVKEQGLGDEIFFLRFAPQLHAAGARVTCCASDKIGGLLKRVPGIAQLVAENIPPPATADVVILAGDLPHAVSDFPVSALPPAQSAGLMSNLREFHCHMGIFWPRIPPPLPLAPMPARVAEMRERLAASGPPPYLGLTWRGGTPPREQRMVIWALYKEIGIAPLAAALRKTAGTFIALQRKPADGEIHALSQALERKVHDFTDLNEDLEGMLALVALLDEYIGVSNTNVHLRASAGRHARVLVPCQPDWRWMYGGRSSLWFPGSTVYRQSLRGEWGAALAALEHDLSSAGS